jgi:hypothetical protein
MQIGGQGTAGMANARISCLKNALGKKGCTIAGTCASSARGSPSMLRWQPQFAPRQVGVYRRSIWIACGKEGPKGGENSEVENIWLLM